MEQMKIPEQENKMGVLPIKPLIIKMSLPMIISMCIQSLYNIVDSIFVAQYSQDGLTAVSLSFPVQTLIIAFAVGTGVGMNSLMSRRLGEKRFQEASTTAANGIFLMILSSLVFLLFGLTLSKPFFRLFTDSASILEMGTSYVSICTIFSLGVFMQIACERIMQASGKTIYSMGMQLCGTIVNIILDPILIFGWFGLPSMGVAGAAIATVIGQWSAMLLGLWMVHKKSRDIRVSFKGFKPDGQIIRSIYKVGFPSILMQALDAIMTFGMNKVLIAFSETAVSVYGVYFKLQSFVFMPIFGLNNGVISIMAYNYGAKKADRLMQAWKFAAFCAFSFMCLGLLLFQLFPEQMLLLFNDTTSDMLSIGGVAIRILSLCFPFAAFVVVNSTLFQAVGNGVMSLLVAIIRQLIVLPIGYLLGQLVGLDGVWYSFPLASVLAMLCSFLFLWHTYKTKVKPLSAAQA